MGPCAVDVLHTNKHNKTLQQNLVVPEGSLQPTVRVWLMTACPTRGIRWNAATLHTLPTRHTAEMQLGEIQAAAATQHAKRQGRIRRRCLAKHTAGGAQTEGGTATAQVGFGTCPATTWAGRAAHRLDSLAHTKLALWYTLLPACLLKCKQRGCPAQGEVQGVSHAATCAPPTQGRSCGVVEQAAAARRRQPLRTPHCKEGSGKATPEQGCSMKADKA